MTVYTGTAIYYTLALLLAFLFAYQSERSQIWYNRKLYIMFSFLTIVLFCGLRFFVGNDYEGYYNGFNLIHSNNFSFINLRWEPGTYLIAYLFSFSPAGYVLFLLVCSFITFYFIFKVLIRENSLKWGIFFTFTLGLLIMVNDQVRQGMALSIFLFSIQYIEEKKFLKYSFWIIVAAMFHYSAIALILVYLVKYLRLKSIIWIGLIVLTYILCRYGIFYDFLVSFVKRIPYYGEHFASRIRVLEVASSNTGLGILFKNLVALIVAIFYNKFGKSLYVIIFLCGVVLANITTGFMLVERFSYYLIYTNIIVFPLLLKQVNLKQVAIGTAIVCLLYFEIQSLFALEKHGAVPYRTIIFENLKNPSGEYLKR